MIEIGAGSEEAEGVGEESVVVLWLDAGEGERQRSGTLAHCGDDVSNAVRSTEAAPAATADGTERRKEEVVDGDDDEFGCAFDRD